MFDSTPPFRLPRPDLIQGLEDELGAPTQPGALAPATAESADADLAHWHGMLAQVGRELAEPLTAALERVTTLATTGRIDRAGLKALRMEVDRARQTGIWCQQIARLASGRVRQSMERVHLTHTVQSVLAYRARELHARGVRLTQSLLPLEIMADASMLFSLLNALVDWWFDCTQDVVELRVDLRDWPARARLHSKMRHAQLDRPDTHLDTEALQERLDTMHWRLLEQTAHTMGLTMSRQVDPVHATLTLEFPNTIHAVMTQVEAEAGDHGFVSSVNSQPLAGSHVLVLAARRDLRVQVRESTRHMGLVVDFVGSVKEAAAFCKEGLPHAIVFESALRANEFDQLVASIRHEVPEFVFIELLPDGERFDISSLSGTGMARVGRGALPTNLPSALVYELTRVM